MRKTTLKVWCFQPDSKKIVPVYMNACGLQMNARKFRQPPWVWHIWTLLMWQTHPSGAPCRIKQTLRVICSSYLNFFFIGGILLCLKNSLIGFLYGIPESLDRHRKERRLLCDWQPPRLWNIWSVLMRWTPPARIVSGCDVSRLFQRLWAEWRISRWPTPPSTHWGSAGTRLRATSDSTRSSTSPPLEDRRAW